MMSIVYLLFLCVCALQGWGICEVQHRGARGWLLFCSLAPVLTFNLGLFGWALR